MALQSQVVELLDKLIIDGTELLQDTEHEYRGSELSIKDVDKLQKWFNELILFKSLCGKVILPWESRLSHMALSQKISRLKRPLSALETIRDAASNGLLVQYEDLIFAEAFADLYEQGQHLYSQGYFLAAGVVFRAVLEEHLRRLCKRNGCTPDKPRPTINDLNMALYKHDPPVYDKSVMLHVTALAAVDNDAAHNKPELVREDVKRLQDGLLDFLARFK